MKFYRVKLVSSPNYWNLIQIIGTLNTKSWELLVEIHESIRNKVQSIRNKIQIKLGTNPMRNEIYLEFNLKYWYLMILVGIIYAKLIY